MTRLEWVLHKLSQGYNEEEHLLWPVTCARAGRGYGTLKVDGRMEYVHRVAWQFHTGSLPIKPLEIRHLCKEMLCFNPLHLAVGTHLENEADKFLHGTRGVRLTEELVRAIRTQNHRPSKDVAEEFDVSVVTINKIRSGRTWKHSQWLTTDPHVTKRTAR